MPRVSVLVPIYGVEKYIERCANSLFAQTMDDIEYIFVDDCTPDRSMELLERIIERENDRITNKGWSVRIFHMPVNRGLPTVRKHAICLATGDYLLHCDSDDWIAPETCKVLYEKAIDDSADIVICDYEEHNGSVTKRRVSGCSTIDREPYINHLLSMKDSWSVWNKLIKRELYNRVITYPTKNMGEDLALYMQLVIHAERIAYVPQVLYSYFLNPYSISRSRDKHLEYLRFQQFLDNVEIVLSCFRINGLDKVYNSSLSSLKWKAKKNIWRLTYDKFFFRIWRDTYPEINGSLFLNPYITRMDKARFVLTYLRLYPRKRDLIL